MEKAGATCLGLISRFRTIYHFPSIPYPMEKFAEVCAVAAKKRRVCDREAPFEMDVRHDKKPPKVLKCTPKVFCLTFGVHFNTFGGFTIHIYIDITHPTSSGMLPPRLRGAGCPRRSGGEHRLTSIRAGGQCLSVREARRL